MNELTHLAEQEKIETLKEKIPAIGKLQDETIRLMKLVKKGKYQDSDMLDIHSLITLAKEQVERLKENEEIEALEETIPEIGRLQVELKLAKERVKQLNIDEAELLVLRLKHKEYRDQLSKLINLSKDISQSK